MRKKLFRSWKAPDFSAWLARLRIRLLGIGSGALHHWSMSVFLAVVALSVLWGGFFAVSRPEKAGALMRTFSEKVEISRTEALPVLIASYRDGPPDMVMYTKDRHDGPLKVLLEEAVKRIGYRVQWIQLSYSRSVKAIEEGKIDIIPYVFYKTPEREKEMRFSESLGLRPRPVYFIVKGNLDKRSIAKMEDLAGYTLGYRDKSYYFAEFHSATEYKKVAYQDDASLVQGFIQGDVDIIVLNNQKATERALYAVGFNDFQYADLVFNRESDIYFLYSRLPQHAKTFDRLDEVLLQMKKEGTITQIYNSFDADPPK